MDVSTVNLQLIFAPADWKKNITLLMNVMFCLENKHAS